MEAERQLRRGIIIRHLDEIHRIIRPIDDNKALKATDLSRLIRTRQWDLSDIETRVREALEHVQKKYRCI